MKSSRSKKKKSSKSSSVSKVTVGTVLPCKMKEANNEWHLSKIIEIEKIDRYRKKFYVHFVEFDRRMDRWVESSDLDFKNIRHHFTPRDLQMLTGKKLTRKIKKEYEQINYANSDLSAEVQDEEEREHVEATKVKEIERIVIGKYDVETWYYSPYSSDIVKGTKVLFICEFCLKYVKSMRSLKRHYKKCDLFHPPGDEIYRDEDYSFWEVNGSSQRCYAQNLTLLSKCFLDHKNLFYDVDPFIFYVLTKNDSTGCHILGYFSREKTTTHDYNLSCILILPPYQRLGLGKYLIEFSYCLSRIENKAGTPEKPLSDLGYLSYLSFWKVQLIECLRKHNLGNLSLEDLSRHTMMTIDDILTTLKDLNVLKMSSGNKVIVENYGYFGYSIGSNRSKSRNRYTIHISQKVLNDHEKRLKKIKRRIKQEKIHWTPFDYKFSPIMDE